MIVDESVFDIINKVQSITSTDYKSEIYWKDAENIEGYIDTYVLINMIEDLMYEIGNKEEEIEDLKRDMEDNYVQVSIADQVEAYDRDFIDESLWRK